MSAMGRLRNGSFGAAGCKGGRPREWEDLCLGNLAVVDRHSAADNPYDLGCWHWLADQKALNVAAAFSAKHV
jgi:hypothetical protein